MSTRRSMNAKAKSLRRQALIRRDGNRCQQCGTGGPLTLDHVIPLSRGGVNALSNLQLLCLECNQRKADS